MNLQYFATTLTDLESTLTTGTGVIAGKNMLLQIYDATGESYTTIAGQQGLSIGRSAETIDFNSKTTGGWKGSLAGLKEWSIDVDGVMYQGDDGITLLENAFENTSYVLVKIIDATDEENLTDMFAGLAVITDFSLDAPYDDVYTYSLSLQGTDELVAL